MPKEAIIRFPLRIGIDKNKEIDEAVHYANLYSHGKVSKHQFIMDAIEEKIKNQDKPKETKLHVATAISN